jgi:hypothetical protein
MKTGGRYLLNNVIVPIKDQLKENNIEIINSRHWTHSNWHSEIDDQTYIVTVLRDPASQIISLYTHNKTTESRGSLIKDTNFNLSKNEMYNEIQTNKIYQNFQSKNFILDDKYKFPRKKYENDIDEALLYKRLNRVNLLLNKNNIKENAVKIQEKIFLDLGIDGVAKTLTNTLSFYNPYSKQFYDTFSNAEKDSLRIYNKIDSDLYNSANYYKL